MWRVRRSIAVVLVGALSASTGYAQVTRPVPLTTVDATCAASSQSPLTNVPAGAACACVPPHEGDDPVCVTPEEMLTRLSDRDVSTRLTAYLDTLSELIAVGAPAARKAFLRFVWMATNDEGDPIVKQVLYKRGSQEPLDGTLPGISGPKSPSPSSAEFIDVLVTFAAKPPSGTIPDRPLPADVLQQLPSLASLYTSKKNPNPIAEQIPAFVQKLAVIETLGSFGGSTLSSQHLLRGAGAGAGVASPGRRLAPMPRAVFKLYAPDLPAARADVSVRDWIVVPTSPAIVNQGADRLAQRLTQSAGRVSTCAKNMAAALNTAIHSQSACAANLDVLSPLADLCRSALADALGPAATSVLGSTNSCPPDNGSIGSDPVGTVRAAFRDFANGLGATVAKGDTTFKNVPRDTVSFGLMTALRLGTPRFSAIRTTLNDNKEVKEDPLPRVVTAAIVNWHPWGYDPSKVLTWRDKGSVRLLAGGTLTPDFGVTVGVGYSPIKGLSVNVGQVLLFFNSPRAGVELDKTVPDTLREDPFKTEHGRSWIFGLSYSFQ